jgi:hypothetical protein
MFTLLRLIRMGRTAVTKCIQNAKRRLLRNSGLNGHCHELAAGMRAAVPLNERPIIISLPYLGKNPLLRAPIGLPRLATAMQLSNENTAEQ